MSIEHATGIITAFPLAIEGEALRNCKARVKMVCILEEMVRELGVKFVKEIICRVQGMAKRKWLSSVMKHTSLIVKRH